MEDCVPSCSLSFLEVVDFLLVSVFTFQAVWTIYNWTKLKVSMKKQLKILKKNDDGCTKLGRSNFYENSFIPGGNEYFSRRINKSSWRLEIIYKSKKIANRYECFVKFEDYLGETMHWQMGTVTINRYFLRD